MPDWDDWTLNKTVILLASLGFMMTGVQVSLFHYRGNFRHPVMWGPVLSAPLLAVLGLFSIFYNRPIWRIIFGVGLLIELAAGIIGFVYHARGVSLRVGGWEMRNFLTGPPIMLPLMLTALSIFGLAALFM